MARADLLSEEFERIARQIKEYVDGEQITVLPIDHGGFTVYRQLANALQKYGVHFVRYVLKHEPDLFAGDHHTTYGKDDYREIVGVTNRKSKRVFGIRNIRDAVRIKNRKVIIVDHDSHHGHSLVGAIKHVFDFYDLYGVKEGGLVSLIGHDGLGYSAHFALSRYYGTPMELDEVLRIRLPESYPIYEGDGRLRLIADMPSVHMPRLESVEVENGSDKPNGVLPFHVG